jgi:hypothetical protein
MFASLLLLLLTTAEVDGLRYFDKELGRGKEIKEGDTVLVSECAISTQPNLLDDHTCTLQQGSSSPAAPLSPTPGTAGGLHA